MAGNEERNAEILRRRRASEFPTDIAKSMGLTRNTVIGVCHRAGVVLDDGKAARATHPGCAAKGEKHHLAKLTQDQVRTVRERYRPYDRHDGLKQIADELGVAMTTIHNIVHGKTWAYL